jgi:hypothetical protein
MKLTKWYPGHIKPVRVGVYQRDYGSYFAYCFWDGFVFSVGYLELKSFKKDSPSPHQNLRWRGVAK